MFRIREFVQCSASSCSIQCNINVSCATLHTMRANETILRSIREYYGTQEMSDKTQI